MAVDVAVECTLLVRNSPANNDSHLCHPKHLILVEPFLGRVAAADAAADAAATPPYAAAAQQCWSLGSRRPAHDRGATKAAMVVRRQRDEPRDKH